MGSGCDWWVRSLWVAGLVGGGLWGWALVDLSVRQRALEPDRPHALRPHDIPFPSVTVCTEIKFYSDAPDSVDHYASAEVEEAKNMLCAEHNLIKGNDTTEIDHLELIEKMAPNIDEVVSMCSWEGEKPTKCKEYFSQTFTSEGLCFNFNMLGPEDMFDDTEGKEDYWTPEEGYPSPGSNYPRRWDSGGVKQGLRVVLTNRDNQHDHKCRGPLKGFTLKIHSPNELPSVRPTTIRVPQDQEVLVAIEPELRMEKSGVGCVKRGTRKLEGFREYTRSNCKFNCLKDYIKKNCQCLPFWLKEDGYPLCSAGKIACIRESIGLMNQKEERGESGGLGCNCLPECVSISYKVAEIMQSPFHWSDTITAFQGDDRTRLLLKNLSMSRVVVYTKDINSVYPAYHYPLIIYRNANSWVVLSLLGLCLLIHVTLLFRLSQKPSRSSANSAAREERFTEVIPSGNMLSEN